MASSTEFVDNLHEVFALFGRIRARRMFGGFGIYKDDLMFALVADNVLYLKADEVSRQAFVEQGLLPFEYVKNGKPIQMSYYTAPDELFDDAELAKKWADCAFAAALRGRKSKK